MTDLSFLTFFPQLGAITPLQTHSDQLSWRDTSLERENNWQRPSTPYSRILRKVLRPYTFNMAKSSRASSVKNNNQQLKKNVFGPVESARTERLSAKLLEIAAQAKTSRPENEKEMEDVESE